MSKFFIFFLGRPFSPTCSMPMETQGSALAVSQLKLPHSLLHPIHLCTIWPHSVPLCKPARPRPKLTCPCQAAAPKETAAATACKQEEPAAAAEKSITAHADTAAVDAAKAEEENNAPAAEKATADAAAAEKAAADKASAEKAAADKAAAGKADADKKAAADKAAALPYRGEWQQCEAPRSEPAAACSSKTLESSETDLSVVLEEVASDCAHAHDEVASHRAELEQIRGCLGISTDSKLPGNFEFPQAAQSARGSRPGAQSARVSRYAGTVSPQGIVRDIHASALCSVGIPEAFFQPVKSKLKDQSHTGLTYVLRDHESWQYLGWMQTGVEGMWANKGALRWKKDHDLHEVPAELLCLVLVLSLSLSHLHSVDQLVLHLYLRLVKEGSSHVMSLSRVLRAAVSR